MAYFSANSHHYKGSTLKLKDFRARNFPWSNLSFCPKLQKLIARRFFIIWYITKFHIFWKNLERFFGNRKKSITITMHYKVIQCLEDLYSLLTLISAAAGNLFWKFYEFMRLIYENKLYHYILNFRLDSAKLSYTKMSETKAFRYRKRKNYSWCTLWSWNYNTNKNNMYKNLLLYACRWLIAENAKIFWSYLKHFWISLLEKIIESWLVDINKFPWIIQSCFLIKTLKRS